MRRCGCGIRSWARPHIASRDQQTGLLALATFFRWRNGSPAKAGRQPFTMPQIIPK